MLSGGIGLVGWFGVYASWADYLNGGKAQLVWCDKILFFVIAEDGCVLGFGVEGLQDFFEAGR